MTFVGYLWDGNDPDRRYIQAGWAMTAIAEHLEAAYHGEIRRLLITVPPGFSTVSGETTQAACS